MHQSLLEGIADSGAETTLSDSRLERPDHRRRAIESAVMALVGLAGVWWLRLSFESTPWCTAEALSILTFTLLLVLANGVRHRRVVCLGLLTSPLIFAVVARQFGYPVPFEMTAIALLGVGSLALGLYSPTRRNVALSVVASGFLVLFTTLISDDSGALTPALIWITICLWHMVANHWERVTSCTPDEVRRSTRVRPLTVFAGAGLVCPRRLGHSWPGVQASALFLGNHADKWRIEMVRSRGKVGRRQRRCGDRGQRPRGVFRGG